MVRVMRVQWHGTSTASTPPGREGIPQVGLMPARGCRTLAMAGWGRPGASHASSRTAGPGARGCVALAVTVAQCLLQLQSHARLENLIENASQGQLVRARCTLQY